MSRPAVSANPRILLVDDDHSTRVLMAQLFELEGHEVEVCVGPEHALKRLAALRYDLLITDQVMPGMTGLELTRAARALHPAIRCVLLTGQAKPPKEQLGDTVWLGKPIDMDELLLVLGL